MWYESSDSGGSGGGATETPIDLDGDGYAVLLNGSSFLMDIPIPTGTSAKRVHVEGLAKYVADSLSNIYVQPNATNTDCTGIIVAVTGAAVAPQEPGVIFCQSSVISGRDALRFSFDFDVPKGNHRSLLNGTGIVNAAGVAKQMQTFAATWKDTVTDLTSIRITSTAVFTAGSWLRAKLIFE